MGEITPSLECTAYSGWKTAGSVTDQASFLLTGCLIQESSRPTFIPYKVVRAWVLFLFERYPRFYSCSPCVGHTIMVYNGKAEVAAGLEQFFTLYLFDWDNF